MKFKKNSSLLWGNTENIVGVFIAVIVGFFVRLSSKNPRIAGKNQGRLTNKLKEVLKIFV